MNKVLAVLIALGALAALYSADQRRRVEAANRTVAITIDYSEVVELSAVTGIPIAELLKRYRESGARAVAIAEDTLGSLQQSGYLTMHPNPTGGDPVILRASPDIAPRITAALLRRIPASGRPGAGVRTEFRLDSDTLSFTAPFNALSSEGVGLNPRSARLVIAAGLEPIGRLTNYLGATPASIRADLATLRDLGVRTVIFGGTQALGHRGALKETAEAFRANGLRYGSIEFGKQAGDARLAASLPDLTIRVHSVSPAEADNHGGPELVERFVKAAKERNVRICYVRNLTNSGTDPVGENLGFVGSISTGLTDTGLRLGSASPFGQPATSRWFVALTALGIAAAVWAAMKAFFSLSATSRLFLGFAGALIVAASFTRTGQKLDALLAALVFPTLAVGTCARALQNSSPTAILVRFARATGLSLLGGLFVVGLLTDQRFLIKADQFAGIKLAHALPILLVGMLFALGLNERGAVREAWARLRKNLAAPILWWHSALALTALLALAMMVMRTGNESPAGASDTETQLRSTLDRVLDVRPRTKEFAFGHPLLILAIGAAALKRRRFLPVLMMGGAVGQVSVVNTFCHLHTPLMVSLQRSVVGAILGAVIGVALYALMRRLLPAHPTTDAAA